MIVTETHGLACPLIPHVDNVSNRFKSDKPPAPTLPFQFEDKSPHLPKPDTRNKPNNHLELPLGSFNKVLAICARPAGSDERPHVVGYVVWRKKDNKKLLYVRGSYNMLNVHSAHLPQTKKTSIPMLAKLLGFNETMTLTLKAWNQMGRDGGRAAGAPQFVSSSVAGHWREI